jgi:hypothetical protein
MLYLFNYAFINSKLLTTYKMVILGKSKVYINTHIYQYNLVTIYNRNIFYQSSKLVCKEREAEFWDFDVSSVLLIKDRVYDTLYHIDVLSDFPVIPLGFSSLAIVGIAYVLLKGIFPEMEVVSDL